MTIPETDVGKLLALYKEHDKLLKDILELIGKQTDMTDSILKSDDRHMTYINRQNDLIVILFDEINRLNKRIDKLEKVIENVQTE